MKAKIIALMSILSIIGLALFAYGAQTTDRMNLVVLAISLSLIPMYFLYSVFILGRYKDVKKKSSKKKTDRKNKDYGKVIEFPKDKKDKDKRNNEKK